MACIEAGEFTSDASYGVCMPTKFARTNMSYIDLYLYPERTGSYHSSPHRL